ncbi:MAG: radical SAM protein [Clostridiales bacterium]|nr:radical SAM protein [Clostridiales bacterium]
MGSEYICDLCPRRCHAIRTDTEGFGFCRAPYIPVVNLIAPHFGEEPVISGTSGSGTVFFEGCSLGCIFCQNHAISHGLTGHGTSMDAMALADSYLKLQDSGVHNINLVTCMHYAPEVARSIELTRSRGLKIPVIANISGYEEVSTLRMFEGLVDIYLTDMKFYSAAVSSELAHAQDYFTKCCLATDEMVRQTGPAVIGASGLMERGVIVRHLMLPGYLFDTKHVLEYLVSRYGNSIYISLMNQYTPLDTLPPSLRRTVSKDHYEKMIDLLSDLGQTNAFVQEGDASGNELLPGFVT